MALSKDDILNAIADMSVMDIVELIEAIAFKISSLDRAMTLISYLAD